MEVGQINRGSELGDMIYHLVSKPEIKTIVDIGTWNGLGSTKCIMDSILENDKKDYNVISIESDSNFHNMACSNLPKIENFNIVLGRIVDLDELEKISDYPDYFFMSSSRQVQSEWLSEDVNNYNNIPNIIDMIPNKIDLLILDGGEFSTLSEFKKIGDRAEYIILDDTRIIKNHKVREIIKESNEYEILLDDLYSRNGFMVAKKIGKK
jgi:hypothetical protein